MGTHEVGERETACGRAGKERTALGETGHGLAREEVVGHQTAAVGVAFEGAAIQTAE